MSNNKYWDLPSPELLSFVDAIIEPLLIYMIILITGIFLVDKIFSFHFNYKNRIDKQKYKNNKE